MFVQVFSNESAVKISAKSCYSKKNHMEHLVKKVLNESGVRSFVKKLLLRKNSFEMLVEKKVHKC